MATRAIIKTDAVEGEMNGLIEILKRMEDITEDYQKNMKQINENFWRGDASDYNFNSFIKDYKKITELQSTIMNNIKFLNQVTSIYKNLDIEAMNQVSKIGKVI